MWIYLIVFFAAFMFDILPFVGPPAWTIMVFLQMKYGLNPWYVLMYGVSGSTLGRYCMSLYFRKLSYMVLNLKKNRDLEFLGSKLSNKRWRSWTFVFLYTLVPLPSTPLFNVMGMARVSALNVLPPFFVGKFISDGFMLYAGHLAEEDLNDIATGMFTWKSILIALIGLISIAAVLFIDWWKLIIHKELRLDFDIWKKVKPVIPK